MAESEQGKFPFLQRAQLIAEDVIYQKKQAVLQEQAGLTTDGDSEKIQNSVVFELKTRNNRIKKLLGEIDLNVGIDKEGFFVPEEEEQIIEALQDQVEVTDLAIFLVKLGLLSNE